MNKPMIKKLTHMNCSWKTLTLSQNSKSVGQIGNIILMWNIL